MIALYTDDCIILGRTTEVIEELKSDIVSHASFLITDEGEVSDFLGVHNETTKDTDGNITKIRMDLSELTEQIIRDVGFTDNSNPAHAKLTPSKGYIIPGS